MKFSSAVVKAAILACALTACGGGGGSSGGGGGIPPGGGAGSPTVSGDMLALAPGRGWNYQATGTGAGNVTLSTYVNVDQVAGQYVLAGVIVSGLVPTALTSHANAEVNLVGGLSLTESANGYNVNTEVSIGSSAQVPGSPLLIGSSLTQGATTTPYPGATETVVSVGSVANASACPTPAMGAQVRYTVQGQTYTVSFVPGCGITQFTLPNGATFNLVSVGSYSSLGDLERARRAASMTYLDTARSLLGLERNDFPAARLLK